MDRVIVYPGAIPLDTDSLSIQRNVMTALGYLAQATFGTGTVVDGLVCAPTAPATMAVTVGPGSIFTLSTIDASAFGSLSSDNADPLVKVGVNSVGSTSFTLTAPSTSGQSIAYLIEAALLESDTTPIVLPYYNSASPSQPYTGPANSSVAQNTVRAQRVQLQLKAGAPATTGTQTTPAVDSGYVGLYVITVNFGAATVTAGAISTLATAPFIPAKLGPGMNAGFSHVQAFTSSGTFTVPAGVTTIRVRAVGGGAGGTSTNITTGTQVSAGPGGNAGSAGEGVYTVTPGTAYTVTVGAGGASNSNGGTSSFGALLSAPGGHAVGSAAPAGVPPLTQTAATPTSVATGGFVNGAEQPGAVGLGLTTGNTIGGTGAPGPWGGGGAGTQNAIGGAASARGAGGGGASALASQGSTLAGGAGAAGIVIVNW